jgi:tetratricopeptide (TPR) repeat protein
MDDLDSQLTQAAQKCAEDPPSVLHYAELAKLQEQTGRAQAAFDSYLLASLLQAALLSPQDAGAWLQLGLVFHRQGRDDRARLAFRAALLTQPTMAEACNNLGNLAQGEEAIGWLRRAVRLTPGRADYHSNLAHALLAAGHWSEGFREWEWRTPSPPRDFSQPRWQGADFAGQTLLVHEEQGFGDSLQFCRYLPLAAAKGGRLLVEARAPLAGLLRRLPGVADIVAWGSDLPAFDWQIPLPSLAALFPLPPMEGAYFSADPAGEARWRERLRERGALAGRRKIGLVWSGNPRGHDQRRALPFAALASLAANLPHCQFFGLQRDLPEGFGAESGAIPQMGNLIEDFDDLAGALAGLDLLISVDTAAAHLAGALDIPVWVLLHSAADWRWGGPDPERSVWYRSARLYRQQQPGDWQGVLERVGADLRRL